MTELDHVIWAVPSLDQAIAAPPIVRRHRPVLGLDAIPENIQTVAVDVALELGPVAHQSELVLVAAVGAQGGDTLTAGGRALGLDQWRVDVAIGEVSLDVAGVVQQ